MSEIKNGGPAFPLPVNADIDCAGRFASGYGGISKREWFAGMALQGMRAGWQLCDYTSEEFVKLAYKDADAMIRAGKNSSPCHTTGVVEKLEEEK